MKKYWRCFVCNDIHCGLFPPDICPTCKVKNADLMRSKRDSISEKCGGQLRVPTFLNSETNDVMCGEFEYEELKKWATKK